MFNSKETEIILVDIAVGAIIYGFGWSIGWWSWGQFPIDGGIIIFLSMLWGRLLNLTMLFHNWEKRGRQEIS
ncbi:MAG: hypothetical protein IID17_11430 [Nitrospinae bacterium]|nr:hypothetical protein [Nitrospinota bacterium]